MNLYIDLYHGRRTLDEELDDWGPAGPVFGPFEAVHTTFMCTIRGIPKHGNEAFIRVAEDCIYYDGMYYGDWTVFPEEKMEPQDRARLIPFDEAKTIPPQPGKSDCDAERDCRGREDGHPRGTQGAAEGLPSRSVSRSGREDHRGSALQTLDTALL